MAAVLFGAGTARAEDPVVDDPPVVDVPARGGLAGLPLVTFAPETSVLFAAVGMYLFDVGDNGTPAEPRPHRASSVRVIAAYTFKNQVALQVWPSVYLSGEDWRLYGTAQAVRYPDRLYALGPDSPDDYEDYDQRILLFRAGFERQIVSKLRLGGRGQIAHATVDRVEEGGILDRRAVTGAGGGRVAGIGPTLAWDSRDRDTATSSGGRHEFSLLTFTRRVGSEFDFIQATLRLRHFFPLWAEHVLAAEVSGQFGSGEVPFQLLATLGGDERMRGYFAGRYRDLHQVSSQLEYRMPLWWRFGLAGFVGAGQVSDDLEAFDYRDPKVAGGGGVRIALSQEDRVNLRVDVAGTRHGDLNFYVSLGEAL